MRACFSFYFFFFNDTATTEIYTLSLHDALPICHVGGDVDPSHMDAVVVLSMANWIMAELVRVFHGLKGADAQQVVDTLDRKSTRLNSSHLVISYAVFCLKKKTGSTYIRSAYGSM